MGNQSPDINEVVEWVRATLIGGYLSYSPSLMDEVLEMDLNMQDVVHVLLTSTNVSRDFAPGCFTFRGPTADCESVAVVVAERSDANRVKLIKVWRAR